MALPIFVQAKGSADPVCVEIAADATVGDLRRAAADACGLRQGILRVGGEELPDDSLPIADAGLAAECMVELDAAPCVHVVWANYRKGYPSNTNRRDPGALPVEFTDWRRGTQGVFQRFSELCPDEGAPSEAGFEVLAAYAQRWREWSQLTTSVPIGEGVTLRSVLADGLYGEQTLARKCLQEQMQSDRDELTSEEETPDAVCPRDCVFASVLGDSRPTIGGAAPGRRPFATPQLSVSSGKWHFEVSVRYSATPEVGVGWSVKGPPPKPVDGQDLPDITFGTESQDSPAQRAGPALGGVPAMLAQCARLNVAKQARRRPAEPTGSQEAVEETCREGETIAAAVDFDAHRILICCPGKDWAEVKQLEPGSSVTPRLTSRDALFEVNFGGAPFRVPPPDPSFRPILEALPPEHVGPVRWTRGGGKHVAGCPQAGSLIPARALKRWEAYCKERELDDARRTAERPVPAHPFDDGWVRPEDYWEWLATQWSSGAENANLFDSDSDGSCDSDASVQTKRGISTLQATALDRGYPDGAPALAFAAAADYYKMPNKQVQRHRDTYEKQRSAGRPPLVPFKAYNLRTGFSRLRAKTKYRAADDHARRRLTKQLKFDKCLVEQGVREHDVIVLISM